MNSSKPTQPATDTRETKRQRVSRTEQLRLVVRKSDVHLAGAVVDMSYSGCAVLLPQTEITPIREFETFDLAFVMGGNELARTRGIVRYLRSTKLNGETFLRVGFEMDPSSPRAGGEERRKKTRFALKEFFQPFGIATHPLFQEETLLFRVLEFSESGLALVTSARNSNLLLGLHLALRLQNPLGKDIEAPGIVQNVKPMEGNRLRIGVELVHDTSELLKEFGDLLLIGSTAVSLKTLKESSFKLNTAAPSVSVRSLDFSQDRSRILALRSHHSAGSNLDNLADAHDSSCSHFGAMVDGEIIACARLEPQPAIAGSQTQPTRMTQVPAWLAKKGFTECTRMAFHPDYRSAEITASFLAQIGRIAAEGGHRYVLASCESDAARQISKAGYEDVSKFTDAATGKEMRMFVLDTQTIGRPK